MSFKVQAVFMETARSRSYIGGASLSDYVMDGAFINPAALSLNGVLAYGGGFTDGYKGEADHEKSFYGWVAESLNGSFNTQELIENRSELMSSRGFPLAAAFSYLKSKTTGALPLRYESYGLNLSKTYGRRLAFGLYFNAFDAQERGGVRGTEFSWSGGLGALYRFSNNMNFGVSGQNLFDTGDRIKLKNLGKNPKVQAALSYKFKDFFKVFADLSYDLETEKSYLVGAFESKTGKFFAFRLSVGYDELIEDMRLGFGLSFAGPKLQLHYGLAVEAESGSALHSVDFSLPL